MKGDDIMSLDKNIYLECDECYTFMGTADECVQDDEGNLYCPICENLLMDGSGLESDITQLSKQFHHTELAFQDYVDYFSQLEPLDYAIRPEFEVLKENNELPFDTLDANQYEQIIAVIDHKNIANYVTYTRKATDTQLSKMMNLQKIVKRYRPNISTLNYIDAEGLYQVQAKRLINVLKVIKLMNEPIRFKQIRRIEQIEKEIKSYFYFDDMLIKENLDTILDTKSKLEGHERISIYQRINQYPEPVILEPTEDFQNWMYNISETLIPYNDIKDNVLEWKQKQNKSSK